MVHIPTYLFFSNLLWTSLVPALQTQEDKNFMLILILLKGVILNAVAHKTIKLRPNYTAYFTGTGESDVSRRLCEAMLLLHLHLATQTVATFP